MIEETKSGKLMNVLSSDYKTEDDDDNEKPHYLYEKIGVVGHGAYG